MLVKLTPGGLILIAKEFLSYLRRRRRRQSVDVVEFSFVTKMDDDDQCQTHYEEDSL